MIDYKLAKEIGATHIHVNGDFYKLLSGKWMNYPTSEGESDWEESSIKDGRVGVLLSEIKRTRTEYEKVTESIFDLKDEFERGELYCKHEFAREYSQVINTQTLAQSLHCGYCFRKVEKEIDWRDESHGYLAAKTGFHWLTPIAEVINDESDCFLELCRVALRANGEIE